MSAQPQVESNGDGARQSLGGARSQMLFRQLNEQIRALTEVFGLGTEFDLVCECTNGGCFDRLAVPLDAYAAIRQCPARFVVKPGHEAEGIERVVDETPYYVVVEKLGAEAEEPARL